MIQRKRKNRRKKTQKRKTTKEQRKPMNELGRKRTQQNRLGNIPDKEKQGCMRNEKAEKERVNERKITICRR